MSQAIVFFLGLGRLVTLLILRRNICTLPQSGPSLCAASASKDSPDEQRVSLNLLSLSAQLDSRLLISVALLTRTIDEKTWPSGFASLDSQCRVFALFHGFCSRL